MTSVISVENLTKEYKLGVINSGTLASDLNKWWARWRGKPDPYAKIGQADHGNRLGDSILALDDVSFTVEEGEVLGIIGKNGAGKSTLLKILSQVTAPTSGVVKVMGRIGSLLEVGTGFHPELTGRENVYLNGAILGMRKDEVDKKFDEIVDFSGVEKFIDTPVKRYSSGMYVRLAFAVAAHLDPEILVVDEVLAVGDAEFQKKCLGKMDDVAGEGRTVMFVSHNMGSVKQLCEKSLLLKNGSIEFLGSTKSAIDKYLHTENTNNSGNLLLKKHQGSGEIKFTSIRFLKDGRPTKTIFMGDPLEIEIEYTVYSSIKKPIIGILIQDNIGRTVLRAYSRESKPNFIDVMNKDGTIHCKFDNLPLMSGKYFVRLWLGYMRHNVIDDVHQSASFEIIENDVYNTGVIPDTNNGGICYVNHTWKITE